MKLTGLITEYNPFHNGHAYHLKKALEVTGADAAVVIMSGDFVQRGAPALLPKHMRAKMALSEGAGAVFELPACYACGSAEFFAGGAISLLTQLGCIDSVCFGSECGSIEPLMKAAKVLSDEPAAFQNILQEHLKQGLSFPKARQKALVSFLPELKDVGSFLASPNNILAIEYLKAILQQNSPLKPFTISRTGTHYHDTSLDSPLSSASAIRSAISEGTSLDVLETFMPVSALHILKEAFSCGYPVTLEDFRLPLKYRLLTESRDSLCQFADVSPELADRICNQLGNFDSLAQFTALLKTKEMTHARISRALFHILLGITQEKLLAYRAEGFTYYARLLGFRTSQKEILTAVSRSSSIPLLTKITKSSSLSPVGQDMLSLDIRSSDLYEIIAADKYRQPFRSEYQKQIIKLP